MNLRFLKSSSVDIFLDILGSLFLLEETLMGQWLETLLIIKATLKKTWSLKLLNKRNHVFLQNHKIEF